MYVQSSGLDCAELCERLVGAVGYPRDGLRKIRYGIYDQRADTIEIRALDGPLLDF